MSAPSKTTPDPAPPEREAFPSSPSTKIGRILVDDGALTEEQLTKALRIQARLEDHKPLGQLAIELGWITRSRLEAALTKHRRGLPLEGILVERGVIRPEQLSAAAEALKGQNKDLCQHLIEIGAISERVYLQAYCEKHNVTFVDVDANLVDRHLLRKVSLRYLGKHNILPLSVQDGRLNVVVSQLGQERVLAELERLFGLPIVVWVAESAKIAQALAALESQAGDDKGTKVARHIEYRNVAPVTDENKGAAEIIDNILLRAIREGASDVHLEPDQRRLRVRFRIDGKLVIIGDYPGTIAAALVSRVKVLAEADIAEHRTHQQGRIYLRCDGEDIDLRASFFVTVSGENAVLRVLRKANVLVGLEEMGFSPAMLTTFLQDVLEPSNGTLIVTGPTGSGKTTTLYAAVQRLVDHTKKVITCEDPVEYVIDGVTQCSVADRPGMSFLDSLRSIVRQDPDIILVGEIRDQESAEVAIQCSLTGHKVLTTFHTEDSVGALVRLIQMDIEPFLIASTVTAVLAQRLLRRQCAHCKIEHQPTAMEIRALSLPRDELSMFNLTRGRGCPSCHYTGYQRRVGVYQLLVLSDALRDAILQKRPTHEIRRVAQESPDFVSMQEDGIAKALRGETTLAEVASNCPRRPTVRPLRHLVEMYS